MNLNPDDYLDHEDFLRDLHNGGGSPFDRQGRVRYPYGGNGHYARLFQAMCPPPPSRRVKSLTFGLSDKDYMSLYKAVALANLNGWVLNTFTTISWELQGLSDDASVRAAHTKYLDLYRRWCGNNVSPDGKASPCAHIWTLERGARWGLHTHMLSFVPEDSYPAYRRWLLQAVRGITGEPIKKPNTTTGETGATLKPVLLQPLARETPVDTQWRVFRYLTKGVTEDAVASLMQKHHVKYLIEEFGRGTVGNQGAIIGKRCGASQTLLPKAQRDFDQTHGLPAWPTASTRREDLRFDETYLRAGEAKRAASGFQFSWL